MAEPDSRLCRQGGYSLLEVTIVMVLLVIVTSAMVMISQTSTSALEQVAKGQQTQYQLKRALRLLALDLQSTSISRTNITTQVGADELDLQVLDPESVGDGAAWGYYDENDLFQEDWYGLYSVSGTNFILQVFDTTDTQQGSDRILCTNVNTSEKGFEISRAGEVITITLRLEERSANNETIAREQTTSLRQRMN